jgi:Tol biopolymer transport system component
MLQDLKGGQAIEISKASVLIRSPRWSPDGAEVAARRADPPVDGMFLIPRLGGLPRLIASPATFPCWSPAGRKIATAMEGDVGFRVVDKATGDSKNIHLRGFRWFNGLDWSPVSDLLAVLTTLENGKSAIWTVRPDGSQQTKVIEANELASPRWSATGDGIYCLRTSQGNTQDLLKVSINQRSGGAEGPASALWAGLQAGGYFTLSGDGALMAYTRSQRYSNLWSAQLQNQDKDKNLGKNQQTVALTRGTSKLDSPSISPDGRWIAYVTEGHIYKMPMEGGSPVQLTFSNAAEFSPAWSPDGRRIAFGSNRGGTYKVWVMDSDGANRQQFANAHLGEETDGQVAWSPGRCILYQKPGNRNLNILDPETGEERPLVQNESAGWLASPVYSPDGKKVAVYWDRAAKNGVWAISLVDNSETFLAPRWCYPAGWSAGGSSVYANCGNSVRLIPVGAEAVDAPPIVLTVSGEIASASVSPDGKNFVYSLTETKSDVWIVDNFDPAYRK